MKLLNAGRYIITRKRNRYYLFDTLQMEYDGDVDYFSLRKNGHVIQHYSYEEVDDWYADTGVIYHYEKAEHDLGKLVFETNIGARAQKELDQFRGEQ